MAHESALRPAEAYDQYLGPAMFAPWGRVLLGIASPRPGERALDLACGTGIVARQLAPLVGEGGHITGVDISPEMLAVARSLPSLDGASIDWREGDAGALPVPDRAFDLLVCQQGFQFFPDRAAAAREMRRVLDDGGRAALSVWLGLDRHPVFRALFEAEARHIEVPVRELAVPFSPFDPDELRRLLEEGGFGRVEIMQRHLELEFPDPDRFVELVVMAGAAVIPQLDTDDPEARGALIQAVAASAQPVVRSFRRGTSLRFPMYSHVAVARV